MNKDDQQEGLVLVIHNVRSAHNVGSMFRTADGAGVKKIIITGYTPAPPKKKALSLTPAEKAFKKTALGAEEAVAWEKISSLNKALQLLRKEGFKIVALEQHEKSVNYLICKPAQKMALLVGNEVVGLHAKILKQCDAILEIPMYGKKNSLNVTVAAGVVLYHIRSIMKKKIQI